MARMWKVKSASSSLRSLRVQVYIYHHFEQISGYYKVRTPKSEIFDVFSLCIYPGIRSVEQALRLIMLLLINNFLIIDLYCV